MKLVTITLNNPPTVGQNYTYKLKVTKYDNTTAYIHYGKFFASAGQYTVTLDLEEILWNNRYKAVQTFTPVLSVAHNQYELPQFTNPAILSDYWYNTVQVVDTEDTPRFTSNAVKFFFVPSQMPGYGGFSLPASGPYVPVMDSALTPHIPSNPPAGFNWSLMFYCVTSGSVKVKKDSSSSVSTVNGNTGIAYATGLSGATSRYLVSVDNGNTYNTMTIVDSCNRPYYLMWQANNGGLQCQGFMDTSDFSIKYNANTRVDMHNCTWTNSTTETATWKLKSTNLSDAEFRAYGEMFNSPYLVLLDMVNGRLHYCTVKSTDYKEKHRTRVDRKPKFVEIEVSASEKIRN